MKKLAFVLFSLIWILPNTMPVQADDQALIAAPVPPDVLILLDLSNSMNDDPTGKIHPAPVGTRKIDIAKAVLKDLLDDDNDGDVDAKDEDGLKHIRFGYMRFPDPMHGENMVVAEIGSAYKDIWAKIESGLTSQGTPLATALLEARVYFEQYVNPKDGERDCRKKYVILISDGEDTLACDGTGYPDEADNRGMHKRRMLTVQRAKELSDANIRVFAVGFGADMPLKLRNTLNWVGKYGNTVAVNPGTGKYDLERYLEIYKDACSAGVDADPASYDLQGYAFLARDAAELTKALKSIMTYVFGQSYSFTAPAIPSVRLVDGNKAYISSFMPANTPFWRGNVKAYQLDKDGTLPVDKNNNILAIPEWDAEEQLRWTDPDTRTIFTVLPGKKDRLDFKKDFLSNADLAVDSDLQREQLIGHIRGSLDPYDADRDGNRAEKREWKLGDIYHSGAVVVGEPSRYFRDQGFHGPGEFYETIKATRTKILMFGANDGMLHALDAATGKELWAFVPPALLKDLKRMALEPDHIYFVDSSPKVADVWFYGSEDDDQKTKDEWRTVLVCGLRKGGRSYFALDITDTVNPTFLWQFPKHGDTVTAAKMGESWSEPAIGRVKVEKNGKLVERWVALIGGGFDGSEGLGEAKVGRALWVIDVTNGEVIKEFSYESGLTGMRYSFPASPAAVDTNFDGFVDRVYLGDLGGQMWVFDLSYDKIKKKSNSLWNARTLFRAPQVSPEKHPIFYPPAVAFDRQGVPHVFFGTGDRENPTDIKSKERFYAVKDDAVTVDDFNAYPYDESKLSNVTTKNTFRPADIEVDQTNNLVKDPTIKGWYLDLDPSEKVLAKPAVFEHLVYFTTYFYTEPENQCEVGGESRLYVVEYLSGGSALDFSDAIYASGLGTPKQLKRYTVIGRGAPSGPLITLDLRGKPSIVIGTTLGKVNRPYAMYYHPMGTRLIYWRDFTRR